MYQTRVRNVLSGSTAAILALMLHAGCGHEPPTPGEVEVTSDPVGAAISIDGQDTGLATPAVVEDLEGGSYLVSVDLSGVTFRPAVQDVEVAYGARTSLHFETGTGSMQVTSTPPGAAIWVDGAPTGEVTPHTFEDLDPRTYSVDVSLLHFRNAGGPRSVDVPRSGEAAVAFALDVATVVLFEGFSNVSCTGCPTMLQNIEYLMHDGGYGLDQLLFIKYAGSNPNGADPMFLSNMTMVRNRASYYTGMQTFALPSLVIQGSLVGGLGTPPGQSGLQQVLDGALAVPVGIYVTVSAPDAGNLAMRDVACTITVHAPLAEADLAGCLLRAVLVYSEVHTAVEYVPGGREYHWVARRDAEVAAAIGAVSPDAPATFTVTLNDPDPAPFNLTPLGREVIVFVQDRDTRAVVQAGSTMAGSLGPAPQPRLVNTGGFR